MHAKIMRKLYLQQKLENIFHQLFPCLQYCHIKAQKRTMMYVEVKTG